MSNYLNEILMISRAFGYVLLLVLAVTRMATGGDLDDPLMLCALMIAFEQIVQTNVLLDGRDKR